MIMNKRKYGAYLILSCLFFTSVATSREYTVPHAPELHFINQYTLAGKHHLLHDYSPINPDQTITAVVEIPTGTNEKWEVEKSSGHLKWEIKDGKPRVVTYLSYPGNYGMIPRTLLPKELGGDGDPLDVIIIGPAVSRGSIVKVHLIGVLRLLDHGEKDDKLIAIMRDSPFGRIGDIEELNDGFKGAMQIIETWFVNYKGPGKLQSKGFEGADQAEKLLNAAISAYQQKQ